MFVLVWTVPSAIAQSIRTRIRKREAVLRVAEYHFAAAEFSELIADLAAGKLDIRLNDQGMVLMRTF